MAISAKSLLSKKAWTGREVGMALLMTLKYAKEKQEKGSSKPCPFTNADISRMAHSLNDNIQIDVYLEHLAIYEALVDSHNVNEGMLQQYYHGFYRYMMAIQEAYRGENILDVIRKTPLIMTQKEADEELERRKKAEEDTKESFASVIVCASSKYAEWYEEGKEIPAPIKKALNGLKKEEVLDNRLKADYLEDETSYNFILPDGRKSGEITSDELSEALNEACGGRAERVKLYHKALFEGDEALKRIYKKNTGKALRADMMDEARRVFDRLTFAASKGLSLPSGDAELVCALLAEPIKVKLEKVEPENKRVSKYDALLYGDFFTYYIETEEEFSVFMEEYAPLYKAVRAELEKVFPKAKKAKAGGYCEWDFATYGDLAAVDFLDYKDLVSFEYGLREAISYGKDAETEEERRRARRALLYGIAIYQGDKYEERYNDPLTNAEIYTGVDYLMHNADTVNSMQETIEKLALPALRFVYGYNEFLAALSEVYELPFLKALSMDLSRPEEQIENLNAILYSLYAGVSGTDEEKEEKRRFLKENFAPIRPEDVQPTDKGKAKIREALKEVRGTSKAKRFFKFFERAIIMTMREGGTEKWIKDLEKMME